MISRVLIGDDEPLARERLAGDGPSSFATAHDDHAVRAIDVAAVDYLLKLFDEERFQAAFGADCPKQRRRVAPPRRNDRQPFQYVGRSAQATAAESTAGPRAPSAENRVPSAENRVPRTERRAPSDHAPNPVARETQRQPQVPS